VASGTPNENGKGKVKYLSSPRAVSQAIG